MAGRCCDACPTRAEREEACVCVSACGMCPRCVFAPAVAGSSPRAWTVSDGFKRRFLTGLLSRCGSARVLESVRGALRVASWSHFTYARSRGQTAAERRRPPESARGGEPPGVSAEDVWAWFGGCQDWVKTRYLCALFARCDAELLRMLANYTNVLWVRLKRESVRKTNEDDAEILDHPALMVLPGSSASMSGVSRYRDFIGCLPVDLSKRIFGLLDENTLRRCKRVCKYWRHLAGQTLQEVNVRRVFQGQVKAMAKRYKGINLVSPTYANFVDVVVPVEDRSAHAKGQKVKSGEASGVQTETVQMEERNVYCASYYTIMLLDKEDPYRVVGYSGGPLMIMGSRGCAVYLIHLGVEIEFVAVMKGHGGSIRAALMYEERNLMVTASCDASIRCWCLKTELCVMVLYGHCATVNCLDVHGDRLVSGSKDCMVKVWSLRTGRNFEDLNFRHASSVQSVKMSRTTVYSSCDGGIVKIWDLKTASLLRVIDAHRSSVKCLFFDKWYLISGDTSGQVKAWSTNCDTKHCLMTFSHPKEVRAVTLTYLRVITGCLDGKIRVFNFLSGDLLRVIMAETKTGHILSMHFQDNSILVNTASNVKLYQFANVTWDYTEAEDGGKLVDRDAMVSEKPVVLSRKVPRIFGSKVASSTRNVQDSKSKKPESVELLDQAHLPSTFAKRQLEERERCEAAEQSVMRSERASCERIKKRGLHHPLKRDFILLKVGAIQKAQCMDEVSSNMEYNAGLRDSWGPPSEVSLEKPKPRSVQAIREGPPQRGPDDRRSRAKTCVPELRRAASQNPASRVKGRDVCTTPDGPARRRPGAHSKKSKCRSV